MDRIRYVFALWCVAMFPPAVLFWFAVHPFIAFWRRLGVRRSYLVLIPAMLVMAAVIFVNHRAVMAVDYGFRWPLAAVGLALVAAGLAFDRRAKEHLKFRTLAGVPEIAGEASGDLLLDEGIYAHVRHPRYTGIGLSVVGVALITNYLAIHVMTVLSLGGLYAIVVWEERELVDRFGQAYRDYMARVPRFFPRKGGGAAP